MQDMNVLIELVDGWIIEFVDYSWKSSDGCSTCGYGTEYTTDLDIKCIHHTATINTDSDSSLSIGFILSIILNNLHFIKNMTEEEFIKWFYEKIKCDYYSTTLRVKEK